MMISHASYNDNFRIFDTFKPTTIERLIVHTRVLQVTLFIST